MGLHEVYGGVVSLSSTFRSPPYERLWRGESKGLTVRAVLQNPFWGCHRIYEDVVGDVAGLVLVHALTYSSLMNTNNLFVTNFQLIRL